MRACTRRDFGRCLEVLHRYRSTPQRALEAQCDGIWGIFKGIWEGGCAGNQARYTSENVGQHGISTYGPETQKPSMGCFLTSGGFVYIPLLPPQAYILAGAQIRTVPTPCRATECLVTGTLDSGPLTPQPACLQSMSPYHPHPYTPPDQKGLSQVSASFGDGWCMSCGSIGLDVAQSPFESQRGCGELCSKLSKPASSCFHSRLLGPRALT